MTDLRDVLETAVGKGEVTGAVVLFARGDDVQVLAVGALDNAGTTPMARDTIFRIASITKPIVAAATMMPVEDGRIALNDPVEGWLPELAAPLVVREPSASCDDVVAASRSITVADLLSSRAGWGFPSDFSAPAVGLLFDVQKHGRDPELGVPPDDWMAALSRVSLLHQPGDAWL